VPARSHADARLTDAQRQAVSALLQVSPVADELARRLERGGYETALVGGSVRDALLGRLGTDLDFAVSAPPEQVLAAVRGWADATWTTGIAFGTVGVQRAGLRLEITTYRTDAYDERSRKPAVAYGDTLEGDLSRRDFTINAMAVTLPGRRFVDPHGGLTDLATGLLRTPGLPEDSFSDDPLRMLRAARFAAQLGFTVDPAAVDAMTAMAARIEIVSAERVRDELGKLLLAPYPRRGLALLVDTGLAEHILPELPRLRLERDEHHRHKDVYEHTLTVLDQAVALEQRAGREPDLVLRLAALLHDVGKPRTRRFEPGGGVSFHHHEVVGAKLARKRLTALRFPHLVVEEVARLVELHLRFHGYGDGDWTDSAVRRYVRDAGPLLDRLHLLTRSDCTTRNRAKATRLARAYDDLEARIARLAEEEELAAIRPDLDGREVMELLGIGPGPLVGQALAHLLELRLEHGPLGHDAAVAELRAWGATNVPGSRPG
jgi:poly(A) polymerase